MNAKRQAVLLSCQRGLQAKVTAGPAPLQLLDGVAHDGGVAEEVWPAEQGLTGWPAHQAVGTQEQAIKGAWGQGAGEKHLTRAWGCLGGEQLWEHKPQCT